MKTIYTVFLLLLLLSCTSSSEKLAWEIANNSQTNKKELTRFLEHYKTNKFLMLRERRWFESCMMNETVLL